MPSETIIDEINRQNRDYENKLADEKRMRKELAKANRKKKRMERAIKKGEATRAARNAGWTGAVILLNEKGQPIGAIRNGQQYVPRGIPVSRPAQSRNLAPVPSKNVRRTWKFPDCEVQEVPLSEDIHGFDVYIKKGGHTRVQRVYPTDTKNMLTCIRAMENGSSPVSGLWEDGMGRLISWENATPLGGPTVSTAQSKALKPKASKACKPKSKAKPKTSSNCRSCGTKGQCSKKTSKPKAAQSNKSINGKPKSGQARSRQSGKTRR